MSAQIDTLLSWIKQSVPTSLGIVIPVSGGTDSALTYWLYNQAMPERTVGVFFGSELRREDWFTSIGSVRKIQLFLTGQDPEVARWFTVLDIAIKESRVLVGTRNKTEGYLGAYSNASRLAYHLPLANTWKTTILELCREVGVPDEIIRSSREADPVCGRPEALAKIPFDVVDSFLAQKVSNLPSPLSATIDQIAYLEDLYQRNSFKKFFPVEGPVVS